MSTPQVYLVEQRFGTGICWRLLADTLPVTADTLMIPLASSDPHGCPTPVTALHNHDYHAAGTSAEYVERVIRDVTQGLKKGLSWSPGNVAPTGYVIHKLEV